VDGSAVNVDTGAGGARICPQAGACIDARIGILDGALVIGLGDGFPFFIRTNTIMIMITINGKIIGNFLIYIYKSKNKNIIIKN
jgi:hypothetical protein